ncbi:DUF1553 domain-containing protein [Allorhodopirellula solitaria]|uniref:Planctomycete cytochrome C n=1 Tax=Allorhodopirellula solitaria TaxID=2527987 RepID=A0A5C5XZR4_9BACT|nr:DUF1553 domain-containing protein [Allorhodopirellula solitaria]TWT67445.1 Planctomycete cytochrome C [Allorhodopirellula solitaria]
MNETCIYRRAVITVLLTVLPIPCFADPVAQWEFGSEAGMPLELHGDVSRDQKGPRPPEFPDFSSDNTALRFDGKGYLTLEDPGPNSDFDFTQGDEITLEAWVRLDANGGTSPMYIIGKGRSGRASVARDNQNWALRVVSQAELIKGSFLFATPRSAQSARADGHWHRWTTDAGFTPGTGWHHVAVAYRFGEPESIRGWLDGKPTGGKWDMGGPTRAEPVVDNDAIWIGSASGGNFGNSFKGWMDGVAVHRVALDDETMASRFHRLGGARVIEPQPETAPRLGTIPAGQVLVSVAEGFASNTRWLHENEDWPEENTRYFTDAFLMSRIPLRYDDWGIRSRWEGPLLVRIAGDVDLPLGEHSFLVRTRSLSRLWIDGELAARTGSVKRRGGNLQPIVPIPDPVVPGARLLPFPQQEVMFDHVVSPPKGDTPENSADTSLASVDSAEPSRSEHGSRRVRVVLELIVGGGGQRIESGEVCVAIQPNRRGPLFVLTPDSVSPLPLTDESIEPQLQVLERRVQATDDATRRQAARSQDAFWQNRHALARDWSHQRFDQHFAESLPPSADGANGGQMIDLLLDQKRSIRHSDQSKSEPASTLNFHQAVLPILQDQCFRCHGKKIQGELRLDSLEHALAGGESGEPAIVPGDPDASELILRVRDGDMPPTDDGLSDEQIAVLEQWVLDGAKWPAATAELATLAEVPLVDDAAFLRRVYLDTVGVGPTSDDVRRFLADDASDKRSELVQTLLQDDRYADHWVSFWMDLLAENPGLLNASLNSTGPFRWFLYDSLRDRKPLDRMVTELIMMRGSVSDGGSAGFAIAGENDSPMAAKAHILASAFLGVELQCARCHDSPFHSTTQEDLFSIAAMLNRKQLSPPKTSRVPAAFFEGIGRESLIKVTLAPGAQVKPKWPFADLTGIENSDILDEWVHQPDDSRERLAALITGPQNQRFAKVAVNHLWNRLIGAGIVQPLNDWEGSVASHPELLDWLAYELVTHDYDLGHIQQLIMTSQLYGRQAVGENRTATAEQRFFGAPDPRRLTAEEIVDSLYESSGKQMDSEELTFVHDGYTTTKSRMTLGKPRRGWMLAGLNNERDRPSLSMPRAQAITDVLQAFGWIAERQQPLAQRNTAANVLQPGILANGNLTMSLTRASNRSELAQIAVDSDTPSELLDELFLRFLARYPSPSEHDMFVGALAEDFDDRVLPREEIVPVEDPPPLPQSTWTNHLVPEANRVQLQWQARVRQGPAADPRLESTWRLRYEDVIWSLVNAPEFVWVP